MSDTVTLNLMTINRMVIFLEGMLAEDVDFDFFGDKIIFDIDYIDVGLNKLFDSFMRNRKYYGDDNLIKVYFSCIKRFYRLLSNIAKNTTLLSQYPRFQTKLYGIRMNLEHRIQNVKNYNSRTAVKQFDKQCIGEDEYGLLLQDFGNNEDK